MHDELVGGRDSIRRGGIRIARIDGETFYAGVPLRSCSPGTCSEAMTKAVDNQGGPRPGI